MPLVYPSPLGAVELAKSGYAVTMPDVRRPRISSSKADETRRFSKRRVSRIVHVVLCFVALGLVSFFMSDCDRGESRRARLDGADGGEGSDASDAELTVASEASADGSDDGAEPIDDLSSFRIPLEELEVQPAAIDDPTGAAMEHFHREMLDVARSRPGSVVRILLFSVSLNGSDRVTSVLRHALQERFGDAGKGFVPIAPGWGAQEHQDVTWSYRLWRTARINTGLAPDGRYGLGGVLATGSGIRTESIFGTVDEGPSNRAVSLFRLFYQAWPDGGAVLLQVDDEEPARVLTASSEIEDRVHEVRAPRGPHRLTVRVGDGEGSLRLYGVVMENEGPGVVVDAYMYLGANVGMMPNFDASHLETQARLRRPDLLVFWMGANDVYARAFTREWLVENYGGFIANVRAGRPEASCLVMSVLDKGEDRNGRVVSRSRVPQVVDAQEAAAFAQGCAFLNLYEATGGEGSVARWHHSNPCLVGSDLLHLTAAGAERVGNILHGSLLRSYDDFLATVDDD